MTNGRERPDRSPQASSEGEIRRSEASCPASLGIVTPELHWRGGTERALAEKVVRWSDTRPVRIFTMDCELAGSGGGLSVHRIARVPGPGLIQYLSWFLSNQIARARLRGKRKPDIVYSPGVNCLDADVIGVHMTFAKYRRTIRAARNRSGETGGGFLQRLHRSLYRALVERLEQRVYSGPAILWAPSRAEARFLEQAYDRPDGTVEVIPHGVDADAFAPERRAQKRAAVREALDVDGARVMLVLSNDVLTKGVDTAVRSLPFLQEDVVLAVAGRFDRPPVRRLARRVGVENQVRCWPHREDVLRYYSACDLLIAPSRADSFNMPVLEALSCGVPAVVSREAGVAEILEDGDNAVLLDDPEDSEHLAQAIRRVFDKDELRENLTREGRKLAEAYDWDTHAVRVGRLIEREHRWPRFLVLATDAFERGGVGRCTRTLLDALGASYGRERVGLLSVWGGEEEALPDVRCLEDGAPKGSGHVSVSRTIRFGLKVFCQARRWRRNLVLVANHPHLAPLARMAAGLSGAPYTVWAHGWEAWDPGRRSVRWALAEADQVWAVSRFTAARMEENGVVPAERLRVLRHALPSEMELSPGSRRHGDPVVLSVARLSRYHAYKGVDTLIEAWPDVVASLPHARLEVVGDGDDRARLERLAGEHGVAGNVSFRGSVSDAALEEAYRRAILFALPGRFREGDEPGGEGFGLVFLEAAAAGLPVIAGRAAGAAEALEHGKTGFLVDPDDPSDVARHVIRLLQDDDLARTMGRAGRARVEEKFSFGAFRENVEALVGELSGGER